MTARDTILRRLAACCLALALVLPFAQSSQAQDSLGDEFIMFVEGKNVLIPFFDGAAAADPTDANNTVASFQYNAWAAPGFRWDNESGADMSAMVNPTVAEGGATLYLRLWVDPQNAGNHACSPGGHSAFDDAFRRWRVRLQCHDSHFTHGPGGVSPRRADHNLLQPWTGSPIERPV